MFLARMTVSLCGIEKNKVKGKFIGLDTAGRTGTLLFSTVQRRPEAWWQIFMCKLILTGRLLLFTDKSTDMLRFS